MKVKLRERLLVLAALVASLTSCERGCARSQGTGAPTNGGTSPRGSAGLDLGGTDCSDGLARCIDGHVEVSVAAHVPHPCAPGEKTSLKTKGPCECPWRRAAAGACTNGCVKEGLEVVAEESVATTQLCAPDRASPVLRELLATELTTVSICADEAVSCEPQGPPPGGPSSRSDQGGIVSVCAARGQPAKRLAGCVHGCATGVSVDPGDLLTSDGAASILCRRAHAERR